ncbi:MAG: Hsp33 family molecular chaperone HslO [Deltaproteobacteria bacterium]|nr:Hsp33 family molecular chaperone HslO [Deltaproteobacteria bacterium]
MRDHLVRVLSKDGSLRASFAVTTHLVEETRLRQKTDPLATIALGRLVTAAALCGSLLKDDQRLAMIVEGSGPLKKLLAETDAHGKVRASVKVPLTGFAPDWNKYAVADAVGRAGFLHVVKDLGLKEPYRGMVQLQTSEIGEDLAYYFAVSEQTPSSVGLGVALGEQGEVASAGGFLIQALPESDETILEKLENNLMALPSLTSLLAKGAASPESILKTIFGEIPFTVQGSTDVVFRCTCGRRQTLNILASLGQEELRKLVEEQNGAKVTCEFCKKDYSFGKVELLKLVEKLD